MCFHEIESSAKWLAYSLTRVIGDHLYVGALLFIPKVLGAVDTDFILHLTYLSAIIM